MMRRIRNREGPKQADEIRREPVGPKSPHEPVYVMTPVRSKLGINKTDGLHEERANQPHRCVAASLSDDGV